MKKIPLSRVAAQVATALVLGCALVAGSCGGSSAPSASTSADPQQTTAYGVALQADMRELSVGVQSYYAENEAYPTVVTQATVGEYISAWPNNPWTHQPMAQGTAVGDFTYTVTADGFQLAGHRSDGTDVMAP
jgi:hypothetical protein